MDSKDLLLALIERGGWLSHLIKTTEDQLADVKTQIRELCPVAGTEVRGTDHVLRVTPNRRWSAEKARGVIHPDLLPVVSEWNPLRTKCELILSETDLDKCFNVFPNVVRIQPKDSK